MTRSRWILGFVAAVAVTAFDCDDWHALDDVFTRSAVSGSRGWTGGDGAVGIRLPGGSDRTLWIFGDSPVTGVDANGQRLNTDSLANVVFGNTIAIQDSSTSPSPTQIHFYARNNDAGCSGVPGSGTACSIADITRLSSDTGQGFFQFFNQRMLGLQPTSSGAGFLWPAGGACLNCDNASTSDDRLLLSFTEILFCDPTKDSACIPMCGFSGSSSTSPCTSGVKVIGNVFARVDNPGAALAQWTMSSMRVAGTVSWATFLQDGTTLYIYGTRKNAAANPDPTKAQQNQLVLAKAAIGDALSQSKWSYLKGGAFVALSAPPAEGTLDKVANVAGWPTVSKIVRRGKTGYVLTHDNPFVDHFVYARTSTSPTSFADVGTTTPRADISAFDRSLRDEVYLRPFYGFCTSPATAKTDRTCALNYHAIAHPHLSFTDDFGLSSLVFSYIIPQPLFPGMSPSIDTYRPKFGALPIDNLSPWCTAAAQPCWAGLAFQYTTVSISSGAQSQVFSYDVRKATRLNVALVGGSGDPDVYVKFGSAPTTTSYDCRPYSSSLPESCDLAVPAGQTTAYVMVRGFSDATYALRVHYAGD